MEESSLILFFAHPKTLEDHELEQTLEALTLDLRALKEHLQITVPMRLVSARDAWNDLWHGSLVGKLQWQQWVQWVAVGTHPTGRPTYDVIVVPSYVPGNATVEILRLALLNRRPILVWNALDHVFAPLLTILEDPETQTWRMFLDEANKIVVFGTCPPPPKEAPPPTDPAPEDDDADDVSTEEFPPEAVRLHVPMDLSDL